MAHAMLLLSHGINNGGGEDRHHASLSVRVFKCKMCNQQFLSFQALGSHRASHKKLKLAMDDRGQGGDLKLRVHKCSICRIEFIVGQALGGHMRHHRNGWS